MTLCVAIGKTHVLLFVSAYVCVFWSILFLSAEEKRGRQLAEIEGNDCDLRTKSRAKCFLSLLFYPLLFTFCPCSCALPLLLCLYLSSELHNREKKNGGMNVFSLYFFPLFSPLCFGTTFDWKTAVVHTVQFLVYTDLNSALFLAW